MRGFFLASVMLAVTSLMGRAWASTVGPLHSHNDYAQSRPLDLALAQGFQSIEADIWHWDDELQVGHLPLIFKGTLREMYFMPLLFRVLEKGGSVHGDGKPFFLWVEFKDGSVEAVELLRRELELFPIFTEFSESGIRWRAVTVILTGNEKSKERFMSLSGRRFATRDSEWISASDPAADLTGRNQWLWYSLDWKRFFSWDGRGKISQRERAELRELLDSAHALGRKVRFFNAPDRRSFWRLARSEGFDLVGTDRVEALAEFWRMGPAATTGQPGRRFTSSSSGLLQTPDQFLR